MSYAIIQERTFAEDNTIRHYHCEVHKQDRGYCLAWSSDPEMAEIYCDEEDATEVLKLITRRHLFSKGYTVSLVDADILERANEDK